MAVVDFGMLCFGLLDRFRVGMFGYILSLLVFIRVDARHPGIGFVITESAAAYVQELLPDLLTSTLRDLTIKHDPIVFKYWATPTIRITNITFLNVSRPNATVRLIPKEGLQVDLHIPSTYLQFTEDYYYVDSPPVVEVLGAKLSLLLTAVEASGLLTMRPASCSMTIENFASPSHVLVKTVLNTFNYFSSPGPDICWKLGQLIDNTTLDFTKPSLCGENGGNGTDADRLGLLSKVVEPPRISENDLRFGIDGRVVFNRPYRLRRFKPAIRRRLEPPGKMMRVSVSDNVFNSLSMVEFLRMNGTHLFDETYDVSSYPWLARKVLGMFWPHCTTHFTVKLVKPPKFRLHHGNTTDDVPPHAHASVDVLVEGHVDRLFEAKTTIFGGFVNASMLIRPFDADGQPEFDVQFPDISVEIHSDATKFSKALWAAMNSLHPDLGTLVAKEVANLIRGAVQKKLREKLAVNFCGATFRNTTLGIINSAVVVDADLHVNVSAFSEVLRRQLSSSCS